MDRPYEQRRIVFRWALGIVSAVWVCAVLVRQPPSTQRTSVSMLDIGQGDSFLIQAANGRTLLIDGGPDERVIAELARVMPRGDRVIDVVIATHPDADHIGGLPLVLFRYTIGLFLTTAATSESSVFQTLFQTIRDRGIPTYAARHGMTLVLDEGTMGDSSDGAVSRPRTSFTILFPDRDTTGWETNAASVVGRLEVSDLSRALVDATEQWPPCCSALFTGDSPASVEAFLAAAIPRDIDVDVLKLGHHGSKTASSEVFLRATSPTLALISAGIGNKYGHPAPETMARLTALSIPWVSTQAVGTYTLTTDGLRWGE